MASNLGKKRSEMWQFFEPASDVRAKCNICKKKISYKTSHTNLKKHMQNRHPTVELPILGKRTACSAVEPEIPELSPSPDQEKPTVCTEVQPKVRELTPRPDEEKPTDLTPRPDQQ